MNRREKILAGIVGGILATILAGFGVRAMVVAPAKAVDKKIAGARARLDQLNQERRAYFADEAKVKEAAQKMFSDRVENTAAISGEMITRYILQCGLKESEFTRLPAGPRKLRGAVQVGWRVQGDGPHADVVDLIYKLKSAPQLSRLDGLTLAPGDKPGLLRVGFTYLTLVMDPTPAVEPLSMVAQVALDVPERRAYDASVERDLFRPYVKRQEQPALAGIENPRTPKPVGGPEGFRIVSLSEWQGEPEVHVLDVNQHKTFRYRPGDYLAGGTVVMVDYRSMPMPGREIIQSESRVILRFGKEYWAIDRGQTLADKRPLKPDQWPPELSKLASAEPAPEP